MFDRSHVTPAIRANDTPDIWLAGGVGVTHRNLPFRSGRRLSITPSVGKPHCEPHERQQGANLGLYSITVNNDSVLDRQTLDAYRTFRLEAEQKGFRHFLEVFDPNAAGDHVPADVREFHERSHRPIAGRRHQPGAHPMFLKIVYHGPAAMEALANYDPSLIVGILGGSAGTTFDAYHMVWEAKKYGAGVGLVRSQDQQCGKSVVLHQTPASCRRRSGRADRSRACLSWRSAEAGYPTTPKSGG